MDRETINNLADLKVQSKILRGLVDVIFDSSRLSYDETSLVVTDDAAIMAVLKAFYREEFDNCVYDLKEEAKRKAEAKKAAAEEDKKAAEEAAKKAAEEGSNNG